jgi:hypothetical protein
MSNGLRRGVGGGGVTAQQLGNAFEIGNPVSQRP